MKRFGEFFVTVLAEKDVLRHSRSPLVRLYFSSGHSARVTVSKAQIEDSTRLKSIHQGNTLESVVPSGLPQGGT
jgi:hypothetical protein